MEMLERVIRTVAAAKEITERNGGAARAAGHEADAAQFDAAAFDAAAAPGSAARDSGRFTSL